MGLYDPNAQIDLLTGMPIAQPMMPGALAATVAASAPSAGAVAGLDPNQAETAAVGIPPTAAYQQSAAGMDTDTAPPLPPAAQAMAAGTFSAPPGSQGAPTVPSQVPVPPAPPAPTEAPPAVPPVPAPTAGLPSGPLPGPVAAPSGPPPQSGIYAPDRGGAPANVPSMMDVAAAAPASPATSPDANPPTTPAAPSLLAAINAQEGVGPALGQDGKPIPGGATDGVMPGTFEQYAKPGESFSSGADRAAVKGRILDDLSQRFNNDPARVAVGFFSGPGNVSPAGSPTPWIHDTHDANGKTVSSYVADVTKRLGGQPSTFIGTSQAAPDAAPNAAPNAATQDTLDHQAGLNDQTPSSMQATLQMLRDVGIDPTQLGRGISGRPGDRLLSLASGLLQGPTFGKGLGKGIENMQNLDMQRSQHAMQALGTVDSIQRNQAMMQMYGLRSGVAQQNADTRSEVANRDKPIGQPRMTPQGMVQTYQKLDGTSYDAPLQGLTTAQQQAWNSAHRTDLANDPAHQAAIATAKVTGADSAKDAQDDLEQLQNTRAADTQALAETQQAKALITQNPSMMGPTLINRGTRALAEMGIAGDPNTLQAIQKMTSENRNTYLAGLTGGHVGGIRSNQELKNLSQAVADVGTSPQAAQWIIGLQQRQIEQKMAWRDEVAGKAPDDPSLVGRGYLSAKDAFAKQWLNAHPVEQYAGLQGNLTPTASAPASGGGGGKVITYDAQGNPQ